MECEAEERDEMTQAQQIAGYLKVISARRRIEGRGEKDSVRLLLDLRTSIFEEMPTETAQLAIDIREYIYN